MNSLAHVEVNVSNLETSEKFYFLILSKLGWTEKLHTNEVIGFGAPDNTHLFIVQTEDRHTGNKFHRRNIGLNHIALRVGSKQDVDDFHAFLTEHTIPCLYADRSKDYSKEYNMEEYYAVFFEDPDRIKLEVVFVK